MAENTETVNEFDIGGFLRSLRSAPIRDLTNTPVERKDNSDKIELLEDVRPYRVDMSTAPDSAVFIDGIQHAVRVMSRDSRPIYLLYAGAGCLTGTMDKVAQVEKVQVACAATDADWVLDLCPEAPLRRLTVGSPPEIAVHAHRMLGQMRDKLEKDLLEQVIDQGHSPIIVDGALYGRPAVSGLAGLAKTMNTQWFADEDVLWTLHEGCRSPIFKIPAGNGHGSDRYSCYTRLHNPRNNEWFHGLVRVEAYEQGLLEPLCAVAYNQRQQPGSDRRWDRHLRPVRGVEDWLRYLRPIVFNN